MATKKAIIRHIAECPKEKVANAEETTIQILLGAADEMPNFYTRQFTIQPSGEIPNHLHPEIEHQQVILEGEMTLVLDGKRHIVKAGDCVYIPPGAAHMYINHTRAPVRFICIVPATLEYTTEWID